ncbi:MAG: hypothetical protein HUK14_00590 [Muribaculaceae bacterium]|nr:hypothetical protein [Muribaculaceae bacterium]
MKRIFTFILVALSAVMTASAQDFAALRRTADESQAAVMSPSAACNRGEGEAFSEFLVKFTVDQPFNAERSKISKVFALKSIANYRALVVTSGHEAGYTQTWKIDGADRVSLYCGFADAPADYHYLFRRAGGKWTLADRVVDDF